MKWKEYEPKWQKIWEDKKIFVPKLNNNKPKFFLTIPYPYTSGALHIGHGRSYTLGDIIARFKRHTGHNVLFPMAFHISGSPILSISDKLKKEDSKTISLYKTYLRIYEDSEEKVDQLIKEFEDPKRVAEYFAEKIINDFKSIGYSVDWTRKFNTGQERYNKFVEWQFHKFKDAGILVKGKHPILWSLQAGQPVGEDDIVDGDIDKVTINEFTMVKFEMDGEFVVTATLRPETLFGVTNLWINPIGIYVHAKVDDEYWYMSREAAEKLRAQGKKVEVTKDLRGRELLSRLVKNPINGERIPILPASFVKLTNGTGIVFSVPAHAPYDYQALKDLKTSQRFANIIPNILPVIVNVPGYVIPAQDAVERQGIHDQKDPLLEEVSKEIYKAEFYSGVLNEKCGDFAGTQVSKVKEKIKGWLESQNITEILYETSRLAVTRSKNTVVVSVLDDQWFIDYSNKDWKSKSKNHINKMKIFPEKYRKMFLDTVDWLDKRPCARRRGLGTTFPFDKEWVIEPLSDSTIYMAYYTIARHLMDIKTEKLTPSFFDSVFLGTGKVKGVSEKKIKEMRRDFLYWYPNDLRHTAPAHISNHLTFFIMHHLAIFPEEFWPKAITLNEMIIREGVKMSKSKGNVIPLVHVSNKYGSDLYRLYVVSSGDFDAVIDWRERDVLSVSNKLEKFVDIIEKSTDAKESELNPVDEWFISKFYMALKKTTEFMTNFEFRDAIIEILFKMLNDFKWLERRSSNPYGVVRKIAKDWLISLAPIIPHTAEEYWKKLKGDGFASLAPWPKIPKINEESIQGEEYIINVVEQIRNISKMTETIPCKVYLYTAKSWKVKALEVVLEDKERAMKRITEFTNKEEASKAIQKLIKQRVWEKFTKPLDEKLLLNEARTTLEKELNAIVEIDSIRDPLKKKVKAMPFRPAIYLE